MAEAQLNHMIGTAFANARRRRERLTRRIVVAVVYLLSFSLSTQYFAYAFNYDAALGWNYQGIYFPFMIVVWAGKWWNRLSTEIMDYGSLGIGLCSLLMIAYVLIEQLNSRSAQGNKYMHGSAHWATDDEVADSGVLDNSEGVYIGSWRDKKGVTHYLRDSGPSHVLCFAPTRSGKGVGLVLPTLLSWKQSALITDIKGELWELTSAWRQKYARNKAIRFEPGNPNGSARWNPFDEIRIDTEYEASDISDMARIVVDAEGKGLDDHWARTAHDLLSGCIAHLLYKRVRENTSATMTDLVKMLANPELPLEELFKEMVTYSHMPNGTPHPIVCMSAQAIMSKPENERGSVISTVYSHLEIYRDPVLAKNLGASDFNLWQMMNHDCPVSTYLITTPDNKERLKPLLRMFINWFLQKHTSRESLMFEKGRTVMSHKHKMLMMLDEFPSLGKLPSIANGLAFIAGYGIKAYLITQDLTQLYEHYTEKESITSNCHIQNAFPPNKVTTAEYLSKLCGETTVMEEQFSESGKRVAWIMGQISKSVQMVKRPLLTPDEALHLAGPKKSPSGDILEPGEMIVNISGFAPIRGLQPLYFKDPLFLKRALLGAAKRTDILNDAYVAPENEVKAKL